MLLFNKVEGIEEHCLFIELGVSQASCFAAVEHLVGYKVNELGMSSGWEIGGIQLTEILLSW